MTNLYLLHQMLRKIQQCRTPLAEKTGQSFFQDRALDFSALRAEREVIGADLVFPEGTLEPARGARLTRRADHVDEGARGPLLI
jgi:hypothetical protein